MDQTNISILSRFSEYGFKSTSVYNKRATGRKWLLALFVFLGVIIGFFTVIPLIIYIWSGTASEFIFCSFIVLVYAIIVIVLNVLWYKKGIFASSFAEYIQQKGKNRIFVKDGKFGLVKSLNYKILIPAMYDKLMWVQDNEVLKAYLNGEEFLIDIHNNKLN